MLEPSWDLNHHHHPNEPWAIPSLCSLSLPLQVAASDLQTPDSRSILLREQSRSHDQTGVC